MNRCHAFLLAALAMLTLAACERRAAEHPGLDAEQESAMPAQRSLASDRIAAQRERNPFLAFEHYYRVRLPEDLIRRRYEATVEQCSSGDFHGCTLVEASLNEDRDHVSASIQLRIATAGVGPLVSTAAEGGEVASQTTRAEDLTDPVQDTDKRLEMLESYRDRLEALEAEAAEDIESLIKVSSELARAQSEIEAVQTRSDYLQKRLDLDLLTISFYAESEDNVVGPIARAMQDFFYNLAAGVSGIITAVAVGLPWALGLVSLLLLVRWRWRRRRRFR